MSTVEQISYHIEWGIKRYGVKDVADLTDYLKRQPTGIDFEREGVLPYDVSIVERNLACTAGLNRMTSLIIGGGGQAMSNTATRIGVGNGTGTAAVGDTDLSAAAGSGNRWFHIMDASFPTQSNGTISLQSTFGSADGNFAWNEFGIDIGTPTVSSGNTVNAILFNHKTSISQGTKTSGQSWVASATLTFA